MNRQNARLMLLQRLRKQSEMVRLKQTAMRVRCWFGMQA
jgi:hypothetical protein